MSIFKFTFKDYIKKQLQIREKARNEDGRKSPKNIQYLNSRTGWIRLTSTVDIAPDSDLARKLGTKNNQLAKKYVLQGGTLFERTVNNKSEYALRRGLGSNGGAYGDKVLGGPNENWPQGGRQELGIRPMPGIVSMNVKSKQAYGSLREATINIQCWSISQLEELELLYMRPGYDLLLEWGSSIYLDNNGTLVTNPPKYINILDVNNLKLSKNDIYNEIFNKNEDSCGNYDAMYGRIKNFTWSSRQDGGFDCTVNIISIGEVIESLKVNYATTKIGMVLNNVQKKDQNGNYFIPLENQDEVISKYKLNKLSGTLLYLQERLINLKDSNNQIKFFDYISSIDNSLSTYEYLKINFNFGSTNPFSNVNNTSTQIYIPLKFLIKLLNDDIIPYDIKNKEPYIKLSVNNENDEPLECFAHKKQVPIDPRVCLITPYIENLTNSSGDPIGPDFLNKMLNKDFQYFVSENRGIIGNIFLNISNLIEIINNLSNKNENGIISLDIFLKELISQIQRSIGNINNFELHIDNYTDTVRIVDIQYLDDRNQRITVNNVSILNIFGIENTVRNYSMQSSIFPEMSNMIAISAQRTGGVLGYNNGTLVKLNEGLINRIVPEINEGGPAPELIPNPTGGPPVDLSKTQTIEEFNKKNAPIVQFFKELNNSKDGTRNVLVANIEDLQNALHDLIYYEINNEEQTKDSKYKGIIPIKLSLTMDGIAGIVIAQIFRIPDERLPLGYKSSGGFKVGFIITGIEQSIEGNDWVTKLDTQTVILRP